MEPAKSIIELCGGFAAVADMTGRNIAQVYRWTYAKEKGGTGGLIPADVQLKLMEAARAKGIPLTPEHFFPRLQAVSHKRSRGRDLRAAQEGALK